MRPDEVAAFGKKRLTEDLTNAIINKTTWASPRDFHYVRIMREFGETCVSLGLDDNGLTPPYIVDYMDILLEAEANSAKEATNKPPPKTETVRVARDLAKRSRAAKAKWG